MFSNCFITIFFLSFSACAEKYLHGEESSKFMQEHIFKLRESIKNANEVLSIQANKSGNCARISSKTSVMTKSVEKSETDKAIEKYLDEMKDSTIFNDIKSILWH